MEKLYSIPDAATALGGVSKKTIEAWLSRGKLRRTKVGDRTMIRESELQRFLDGGEGKTAHDGHREAQ
jgi:excisionase family DNA binding protein